VSYIVLAVLSVALIRLAIVCAYPNGTRAEQQKADPPRRTWSRRHRHSPGDSRRVTEPAARGELPTDAPWEPWQRGPTQSLTEQRRRCCLRSPAHALPEVFHNHRFPYGKPPGLSRLAR
jgi:hypothetical protein